LMDINFFRGDRTSTSGTLIVYKLSLTVSAEVVLLSILLSVLDDIWRNTGFLI